MDNDSARFIPDIIRTVNATYGPGTLQELDGGATPTPVTTTGLPALNDALGCGGWPQGRIIEVFGNDLAPCRELAVLALAEAQAAGQRVAVVDVEHAFTPESFDAVSMDLSRLLISQPDNAEQALDIAEALVRSGEVGLLVFDNVAGLVGKDELEGNDVLGSTPRIMSRAMRKLCTLTTKTGCTVIFLNRIIRREGVVFGPSEYVAGGNALKYYASVRVDVRVVGTDPKNVRAKIVKNKLAPPFVSVDLVL